MLHVKAGAKDSMWKIVQENRKLLMANYVQCSYLYELTPDPEMSAYHKYINTIASAQEKENLIQSTQSNVSYQDVDENTFETAAEMYTYLYSCPSQDLKNQLQFVEYLFTKASTQNILLALISTYNSQDRAVGKSSFKILTNIMKKLNLNQHETIQNIKEGKGLNVLQNDKNVLGLFNTSFLIFPFVFNDLLGSKKLLLVSNHPVHLIDEHGQWSPTALGN